MKKEFFTLILLCIMIPGILASPSATITQSGADSGTVMKGVAFTLTVSGLSGSGTVSINPPAGFEIPEDDKVQAFSEGTSSISFTTLTATEKLTSQTLTAQISIAGSPSTATTSSFNVVLAPSIAGTASPTSKNVTGVTSFDISINVQNSGETTAQGVTASITLPTGLTTSESAEKSVGEIGASSSSSIGWTITVGTPSASSNIVVTIESSNSESDTVTIPVIYETTTGGEDENPPGGGGGGGAAGAAATGTIIVTEAKLKLGYSQIVKAKERFKLSMSNNQTHYVTVDSLSATSATITVSSTPQQATLNVGDEKKFDWNSDSYYDLSVKLNKVNATHANLTLKSISEKYSVDITEADKETTTPAATGTPVSGGQQQNQTVSPEKKSKMNSIMLILIIGIIVLIAIIIAVILYLRFARKKESRKYLNRAMF